MTILITGICGFVGSTLAASMLDQHSDLKIVGIDNLSRPGSWNNREKLIRRGIQVIHGDIRCAADLESISGCDWIIDAAANASVLAGVQGSTTSRQLVDNNLSGTINLLESCKNWKACFTLLSTSRVYSIGALSQIPVEAKTGAFVPQSSAIGKGLSEAGITETFSTAAPVSLYGATKLASEVLALEYGAAFDFPVWINRCGVMAGAGQFGRPDQGIFSFWLHSWREKRPLKYIGFDGQGHQVRDCLHPRDLVSLLMKQIAEPVSSSKPRIVNVSGGLESARSLAQLSQWNSCRWGEHAVNSAPEPRPYDLPWVVLDSSQANQNWSWQPQISVDAILTEIADFADSNPNWIQMSV